ncbi:hypothetical protein HAX54_015257, partial [Datura stramonium]|nr:hypothetical protein [Datura stramonium]
MGQSEGDMPLDGSFCTDYKGAWEMLSGSYLYDLVNPGPENSYSTLSGSGCSDQFWILDDGV